MDFAALYDDICALGLNIAVLRVIEMSDCMQFSTTIYTDRDNNPGVHSLLTRVHKSEVHIVSKLYGATMTIMFRHEVSMKSALLQLHG